MVAATRGRSCIPPPAASPEPRVPAQHLLSLSKDLNRATGLSSVSECYIFHMRKCCFSFLFTQICIPLFPVVHGPCGGSLIRRAV